MSATDLASIIALLATWLADRLAERHYADRQRARTAAARPAPKTPPKGDQ